MINAILAKLCEVDQLLDEKLEQTCEFVMQGELLCEKLDAILDPDAECPPCPEADCRVQFWWGDTDTGVFDEDYVHEATVNGTATSTPLGTLTTKGQVYQAAMTEANNVAGASVSLVTDVAIATSGKPEYLAELDAGTTLTMTNGHSGGGGAVLTITATEEGCTATFTDNEGNAIESYTPVILE